MLNGFLDAYFVQYALCYALCFFFCSSHQRSCQLSIYSFDERMFVVDSQSVVPMIILYNLNHCWSFNGLMSDDWSSFLVFSDFVHAKKKTVQVHCEQRSCRFEHNSLSNFNQTLNRILWTRDLYGKWWFSVYSEFIIESNENNHFFF